MSSGAPTADTAGSNQSEKDVAIFATQKLSLMRRVIGLIDARDVIIGLADGLTVPFALTAGLSALGSSKLVIIGGLAELLSGSISMGIGGYFSTRAERDNYRYLDRKTKTRLEEAPQIAFESEVFHIFNEYGVDHRTTLQIADCLWNSDADKDKAQQNMSSFLLKFGECVEPVSISRVYASAVTIALSYFLGGLIPMIPYFADENAVHALFYSIGITAAVLLVFGAIKGYTTGSRRERIWLFVSAIETLVVGTLAAAASYGVVRLIDGVDTAAHTT